MSVKKPLAEELRPDELNNFIGQEHLKQKIQALMHSPRLPSLLLFGPPGCGKSSLALLLAKQHSKNIIRISAPEAGLQTLRKQLQGIDILILDELHRFSKAQQDFFLPLLESGDLTLIATTTENPSFSITKQLLSRLHVLRLRKLLYTELIDLGKKARTEQNLDITNDVIDFIAMAAYGDARTMLNLLEYINTLPVDKRSLEDVKDALPEMLIRHDKDGDNHYEVISALIKSIRGSDPNAALYYLACLLEGGEDIRFVARRLILSASEDVGLADPYALTMAVSCYQAIDLIGMPEAYIPLAETTVYLALARKSNSTYAAYANAQKEIKTFGAKPVPLHLRNASTQLQREWGYGEAYKYPHVFPDSYVEQEYFPNEVKNRKYYLAKDNPEESRLNMWLNKKNNKK